MAPNPFREAGLPRALPDTEGLHTRFGLYKGVVRAVYPALNRVDIEPELGGLVTKALVVGDIFPELHADTERPQHVVFAYLEGNIADPVCFIIPYRRMMGPDDGSGADEKDRHRYDKNQQIYRVKNITVRITPDDKIYLFDAESDDYLMYDMGARTLHAMVPHVFLGTDTDDRFELHTGDPTTQDRARLVIPKYFLGKTGIQDQDGITYIADTILHLASPAIKLTAEEVVVDPVSIKFGNAAATEPLILGHLFQAFLDTFLVLFNAHQHTNVQTGGAVSGPPSIQTPLMPSSTLSTIAKLSE
jgi:hypothetical protein